jgi:hypothetical protein
MFSNMGSQACAGWPALFDDGMRKPILAIKWMAGRKWIPSGRKPAQVKSLLAEYCPPSRMEFNGFGN